MLENITFGYLLCVGRAEIEARQNYYLTHLEKADDIPNNINGIIWHIKNHDWWGYLNN